MRSISKAAGQRFAAHALSITLVLMVMLACKESEEKPETMPPPPFQSVEIERFSTPGGNVDSMRLSTRIVKTFDAEGKEEKSVYYAANGSIMMQFFNDYKGEQKSRVNWRNRKDSLIRYVNYTYDTDGRVYQTESFNAKNEFLEGYRHIWKENGTIEEKAPIVDGQPQKRNAIYFYNDQDEFRKLHEFDENDSLYYIAVWKYTKMDSLNNWIEREFIARDTLRRIERRTIKYQGEDTEASYPLFFKDQPAPPGFEETSPSFTSDGETMVFARYEDWVKKVPYIATRSGNSWVKERLTFADTLYNLAIAPRGNRIVYKTFEGDENETTRTFYVDRTESGWGTPVEIESLYNTNAGYFQIMEDGALYFFARSPERGIYYVEPDGNGSYIEAVWLSDNVSLEGSDSFDILMHPEENKLIITQAYSTEKYPDRGEIGHVLLRKGK